MVAKLRACRHALDSGVADVVIADGRDTGRLAALAMGKAPQRGPWTRLMLTPPETDGRRTTS
jgi:hypothetical protein